MKKTPGTALFLLIAPAFWVAGCASFVPLKPGAEAVHVAQPTAISQCTLRGSTHVSVLDKVGPISRSEHSVESNLTDLARNSALGMNGNTVVASGPVVDGGQDFAIYNCAPKNR